MNQPPQSPEPPKIKFPCDYPIKVVGDAAPDYKQFVLEIIKRHAPDVDEEKVSIRLSNNNNYYALTVYIRATGEAQIKMIFEELKISGRVKMVL
jgi:putative lipoic acid-binding regulatory protein